MDLIRVDPIAPELTAINRAVELLRAGRLVAFPTETVYGLGANALDPHAVERIYAAKGRPSYNPLIVHVARASDALLVAASWPEQAERLSRVFWPGPLTLVLPKRGEVPDGVTAGLSTVAVRVPAHPVAHALLVAAQLPIAAPSANRSNMLSPTTAAHVAKSLGDAVDLILDGGPTNVGIESTVLDLTTSPPTLLRPGTISADEIIRVIGAIQIAGRVEGDTARPSPGMLGRHYSPRARLIVVDAMDIESAVRSERSRGRDVGALVITASVGGGSIVRMPESAAKYAARLYESLHSLDDVGCDVIVVERVPTDSSCGRRTRPARARDGALGRTPAAAATTQLGMRSAGRHWQRDQNFGHVRERSIWRIRLTATFFADRFQRPAATQHDLPLIRIDERCLASAIPIP